MITADEDKAIRIRALELAIENSKGSNIDNLIQHADKIYQFINRSDAEKTGD